MTIEDRPAEQPAAATSPPVLLPDEFKHARLRVYGHSNFLYWWIVWAYGFLCAGFTWLLGSIKVPYAGKEVLVSAHPWVGISFTALLLAVAFLTNFRLKGSRSVIAILSIALLAFVLHNLGWWDVIVDIFPNLMIFMNLAFYLTVSAVLLLLWLLATFVLDRLTFWEFTPSQVTRRTWVGDGTESYDALGLHIDRVADDYFINRILGLGFVPGIKGGTADLRIYTSGAMREKFTIENVMRPNLIDERIRKLTSVKLDQ